MSTLTKKTAHSSRGELHDEDDERMEKIAREVLALRFVPGSLLDLAKFVSSGDADDEACDIIEAYHAQRMREHQLA